MIKKKHDKILHLKNKNTDKRYKKFRLLKRFDEEDEMNQALTPQQKILREEMRIKYMKIRDFQSKKDRGEPLSDTENDAKKQYDDT